MSKSKRTKAKNKKTKNKKAKSKQAKGVKAKGVKAKGKKAKGKKSKAKKAKGKQTQGASAAPQAVTPYLAIRDAARAIEFYRQAFDAMEMLRLAEPGGRISHAEIAIGDARIMLSDEHPELDVRGPEAIGGSPVMIHLYVPDVDAVFARAIEAGAKSVREPDDMFYGDRAANVIDPFGHRWFLSTRKEEVPNAEVKKRYAKLFEP